MQAELGERKAREKDLDQRLQEIRTAIEQAEAADQDQSLSLQLYKRGRKFELNY
jgi:hypothetical protein